jgi:DNA-directed RNA polymerase specialized sigma subunit
LSNSYENGSSEHFRFFATALKAAIARCETVDKKDFLDLQNRQVDKLVELEERFKQELQAHRWGASVYEGFIHHICNVKRNILDGRPYFRERQEHFTEVVSVALHDRNTLALYSSRFNYRFVRFAIEFKPWPKRGSLYKIFKEIEKVRNELVTMNMPLAISRAKIFYSRTPRSHLSYMDEIQTCAEGLLSAVDKFVPPFSPAFRSTAIGRMTGNLISSYSETLIHFWPTDKRKIYRANKVVGKHGKGVDPSVMVSSVNEGVVGSLSTSPAEIADLLAAASTISSDLPIGEDGNADVAIMSAIDRYAAPESSQPDVAFEKREALEVVMNASEELPLKYKKLLALWYGGLYEI